MNGDILVETTKFDTQLIQNPSIKGTEYQQGPLYRSNLRAAVLERDNNQCVYCDKSGKNTYLQMDHVHPKSKGGSDRYDNRVAACKPCNTAKGNQTLEEFLKDQPRRLAEIKAPTPAAL